MCKQCTNKIVVCMLNHAFCCRRVNPFNQSGTPVSDGAAAAATADGSTFPVRFVGSQQVLTDRGTSSTTTINVDFLQRVSIACYAERCISYSKSVRPSVRPSVCHTLALSQNDTSYDHGVFTGG